jgi:hypothetical protein
MNMQSLLNELNALVAKLESGNASLGEIEAFAAVTAQLHERAIILRYKVYESNVYGSDTTSTNEMAPVESLIVTEEVHVHQEEVEAPVLQESIEEVDDSSNLEFDLFSIDEEPTSAPIFENHDSIVPTQLEDAPIERNEPQPIAPEPELVVQTLVEETTAAPIWNQQPTTMTTEVHGIYRRLDPNDDSLGARLMKVRVETLHGIFGFNERNEIIHELFGGSAEDYSQAIEQLDRLQTNQEARALVSQYANRFGWDEESDLALDFIQKIERRYA